MKIWMHDIVIIFMKNCHQYFDSIFQIWRIPLLLLITFLLLSLSYYLHLFLSLKDQVFLIPSFAFSLKFLEQFHLIFLFSSCTIPFSLEYSLSHFITYFILLGSVNAEAVNMLIKYNPLEKNLKVLALI